jgi:DNA modification methylase
MTTIDLRLGDCLEIMRTLPRGSVDAAITDPPYGIGECRANVMSRGKLAKPIDYGEFTWDSQPATAEQISEIMQVSRNQVIFGGNYFSLPPSSSWIVWDKLNGTNDFADCELAWTSYGRAVRKFAYMWNGMIKQKPEQRYHPTQKPLELMEWVILNYSQPGDTILDPFMGSGTTGVACVQTGRNFIGIEIDEGYFKIAEKRIHDAQQQPNLFDNGVL